MRLIACIALLLVVAGCQSVSDTEDGADTNSGDEMRGTDMTSAEELSREADELFNARKFSEGAEAYKKAVKAAENEGNTALLVRSLCMVARCYNIQGEGAEGRPWLERAAALASPEEPEGWSRYLGTRGRYEWKDEKDNARARQTFIEWYEFCQEHELYSHAVDAAHMVAIVGGPDEQVTWALKGIEAAEQSGDEGWLGPLWNNLGWTYDERGEHEKALDALRKAREYHHKHGTAQSKLVADFAVSHALRKVKRLEEAREWLEKCITEVQRRLEDDPDDNFNNEWMGWGRKYMGELLVDEGLPEQGLAELKKARPYLVKAGIESWAPTMLESLDERIKELEAQ